MSPKNTPRPGSGQGPANRDALSGREYEALVERLETLMSPEHVDILRKETGYNPRQRVADGVSVVTCMRGRLLERSNVGVCDAARPFYQTVWSDSPAGLSTSIQVQSGGEFFSCGARASGQTRGERLCSQTPRASVRI